MPTINLGYKRPREKTWNKQAYQRVYQSPQWKELRDLKKRENPLCEHCEELGVTKQTEEIHHVIPFQIASRQEDIDKLAFDIDNLASLCIEHHKAAHVKLKRAKIRY